MNSSTFAHAHSVSTPLLIVGGSVRAAAWSASRSGMAPWGSDCYFDSDLARIARVVPVKNYPRGLVSLFDQIPPMPWMYTGGLENHPALIDRMEAEGHRRGFCLWGITGATLREIRDPWKVAAALARDGLPTLLLRPASQPPPSGELWLRKKLRGTGGLGVAPWSGIANIPQERTSKANRFLSPGRGTFLGEGLAIETGRSTESANREENRTSRPWSSSTRDRFYFQKYVAGISASAIFLARSEGAGDPSGNHAPEACEMLGVTRQLIGEDLLLAPAFAYCGSIGPWPVSQNTDRMLRAIGRSLAKEFPLRGLFGVDFILDTEGMPWPVEVNPRYTASCEVLELARGIPLLARHRGCFSNGRKAATRTASETEESPPLSPLESPFACVGKAVLFAARNLRFPEAASLSTTGFSRPDSNSRDPWDVLPLADIPSPGSEIPAGAPVCTLLAEGSSWEKCRDKLIGRVREFRRLLEFPQPPDSRRMKDS